LDDKAFESLAGSHEPCTAAIDVWVATALPGRFSSAKRIYAYMPISRRHL